MARALLLSTAPSDSLSRPYPYDELNRMKQSAQRDKFGQHQVTERPEDADVILFVENCNTIRHYLEARNHPYLNRYREKCFLYSKSDHPLAILPGVYASVSEKWYDRQRTRTGGYLTAFSKDFLTYRPGRKKRNYLYSFMGAVENHPVRRELLKLDHEAQFLCDTSTLWPYGELESQKRKEFEKHYVDISHSSKFILCPRGIGVSSTRLFECMRMGRAPVIIADGWVPPDGPDWDEFSVRVREDEVTRIPSILAERAREAYDMGRLARETWEDWFSIEATFHRTVEWCLDIKRTRTLPESLLRYSVLPQLVQPVHARAVMRVVVPRQLRHVVSDIRDAVRRVRSNWLSPDYR